MIFTDTSVPSAVLLIETDSTRIILLVPWLPDPVQKIPLESLAVAPFHGICRRGQISVPGKAPKKTGRQKLHLVILQVQHVFYFWTKGNFERFYGFMKSSRSKPSTRCSLLDFDVGARKKMPKKYFLAPPWSSRRYYYYSTIPLVGNYEPKRYRTNCPSQTI